MAQEKEIKIILKIDFDEFIRRIENYGFVFEKSISQTDIYFDTKDWYLYENIAALRLRQVNGLDESFSFKKVFCTPNNANRFYIEEIETKFPLNNSDELKDIFSRLKIEFTVEVFTNGNALRNFLRGYGYFDKQVMPKERTVYVKNGNEIVIDNIENVGVITELECAHDDPLEIVKNILADSEWERSIEGTSYIWLKNVMGLNSHIANQKKFDKIPDWNVWDNEREMYKKLNTLK